MDYYINDHSLRGQFKDVDDFFTTLREFTLPVLRKIESSKENIIWKKETLWQSKICNEITLGSIPQKKNEQTAESIALKVALIKLTNNEPFWSEFVESNVESNVEIKEYKFDKENRDNFLETNCFIEAINNEGAIISFIHDAYMLNDLNISICKNENSEDISLDNIYSLDWWNCLPTIKTWRVKDRYILEVRAKEYEYHPPHFHVSQNEHAAVFKLENCSLYRQRRKLLPPKFLSEILEWYSENHEQLKEAWYELHPNRPYRIQRRA